ncbi:TraH_2 family protein [Rhizobium sp. CF080]|nr:TraH_2 family protein [Rhizobium sp. CF080]
MDAAIIEKCADPSLKPAVVEQFVEEVGSTDPLAVTVNLGGRRILVPKPSSPGEALDIVRQHVGKGVVRVGITQYPAGVGIGTVSDLPRGLVDACENLRMGTQLFAKVVRIVARWYGNPTDKGVLPPVFEDAIYAWKTGYFEGVNVFQADDPGRSLTVDLLDSSDQKPTHSEEADRTTGSRSSSSEPGIGNAAIRIDLSRILGP